MKKEEGDNSFDEKEERISVELGSEKSGKSKAKNEDQENKEEPDKEG